MVNMTQMIGSVNKQEILIERGYIASDKLNILYLVLCRRGCDYWVAGESVCTLYFACKTEKNRL